MSWPKQHIFLLKRSKYDYGYSYLSYFASAIEKYDSDVDYTALFKYL